MVEFGAKLHTCPGSAVEVGVGIHLMVKTLVLVGAGECPGEPVEAGLVKWDFVELAINEVDKIKLAEYGVFGVLRSPVGSVNGV
ncbi:hypothetical protein ES703_100777 [subsurface metagenome]